MLLDGGTIQQVTITLLWFNVANVKQICAPFALLVVALLVRFAACA